MSSQLPLFAAYTAQFPATRYQGSKAKLVNWIWKQISHLKFHTCLDAFGGTGAVAFRLKQAGKQVTFNDVLQCNWHSGRALIENHHVRLSPADIEAVCQPQPGINYPDVIQRTFHDIYFTDEENAWLDRAITNVRAFKNPWQFSLAFYALCQAAIIKRPYNLFHRKNLYVRLAEVERSFGNKTTWDKPFAAWFRQFAAAANQAVFDNGRSNRAVCYDALDVPGEFDLVYIDPPYISKQGTGTDYRDFYHFLEGLTCYDEWEQHIDYRSRHRRLIPVKTPWADKHRILAAFEALFQRYRSSILVVSYRSDGIPSPEELVHLLSRFKKQVQMVTYGRYQYVLSTNTASREILLTGT